MNVDILVADRQNTQTDDSPSLWQSSFKGKVIAPHVRAGEMTIFNQTAGDTSVRRLVKLQLGAQTTKKWRSTNHFPSPPLTKQAYM